MSRKTPKTNLTAQRTSDGRGTKGAVVRGGLGEDGGVSGGEAREWRGGDGGVVPGIAIPGLAGERGFSWV